MDALEQLNRKVKYVQFLIIEQEFNKANDAINEAIEYATDNKILNSYIPQLRELQTGIIKMIYSPKKKSLFSFSRLKLKRKVGRPIKSKSRRKSGRKSKSRRKSGRKSKSRRKVGRPRKSKSRRRVGR